MTVSAMIEATIGKEGGYVNHPDDRGGATKWGITEAIARKNGYSGQMKDLPRATAVGIYTDEFFNKPGFGRVSVVSPKIAEEMFDSGVNFGQSWPGLWLQIALNAFNDGEKHYPDLKEDGNVGPTTVATLKTYLAKRGADAERVMLVALNVQQGARYLDLSRSRKANESFAYGWMANRVGL